MPAMSDERKPVGRETIYGMDLPVWEYKLVYKGCGHEFTVRCAANDPIPELVECDHECSGCYKGPAGNVWD